MTLSQAFKTAVDQHVAYEKSFDPIIAKFEEIKKVLEDNFQITSNERKWFGKSKIIKQPVLSVEIKEKINHTTGKYLYISINSFKFIMGLGEIGELKDRLYFIEGTSYNIKSEKTSVYFSTYTYATYNYYLEDKITDVQLFSFLIKNYNEYLVAD